MRFIDFNNCEASGEYYGGNAGRKIGIRFEGASWMLKFPEPTHGMSGKVASYTTSPLSEYLGSHIYEMLGIPVHETLLGHREGKLVCACRDFTVDAHVRLIDFHDLKNSMPDDTSFGFERRPSDGRSVYFSDVLGTLYNFSPIAGIEGSKDRFWDMFVVDSLIGNADRNNSNWGFLRHGDKSLKLAPVFDNGKSFFNKRRASQNALRLEDENLLKQDILVGMQTCYLKDDGHHINPAKYIRSGANEDCTEAVLRLVDSYDRGAVETLIDELPEEVVGITVAPAEMKGLYKRCLQGRMDRVFIPVAEHIRSIEGVCEDSRAFLEARDAANRSTNDDLRSKRHRGR